MTTASDANFAVRRFLRKAGLCQELGWTPNAELTSHAYFIYKFHSGLNYKDHCKNAFDITSVFHQSLC